MSIYLLGPPKILEGKKEKFFFHKKETFFQKFLHHKVKNIAVVDVGFLVMSAPAAWFVFFSMKDQCLRVLKQPPISHEGVSIKIT